MIGMGRAWVIGMAFMALGMGTTSLRGEAFAMELVPARSSAFLIAPENPCLPWLDVQSCSLTTRTEGYPVSPMAQSKPRSTGYGTRLGLEKNTRDTLHAILGYTTVSLAIATAVTAPEKGATEYSTHETLGKATLAFSLITLSSGILFNPDLYRFDDLLEDDTQKHALLNTIGVVFMGVAVSQAPDRRHAAPGLLGGLAIIAGIYFEF